MKHLTWTLLGMTELELFNPGMESPSDYLAQVLYAVFIIAALVLLVNMMIAVLSNTYQRVQVRLPNAFNRSTAHFTVKIIKEMYYPITIILAFEVVLTMNILHEE